MFSSNGCVSINCHISVVCAEVKIGLIKLLLKTLKNETTWHACEVLRHHVRDDSIFYAQNFVTTKQVKTLTFISEHKKETVAQYL